MVTSMTWQELIKILGSENEQKIKDCITEEIIDNLRESIQYEWVLIPSEIDAMFEEMGKEVLDELKKKYKKELKKVTEEELKRLIVKVADGEENND